MTMQLIETTLRESFADGRLSKQEKSELTSVLADVADDHELLNFARNKAFDIVCEQEGQENYHAAIKWLEKVIRAIDSVRVQDVLPSRVCFSPGSECRDNIIGLIRSAKSNIDICVFTISDDRISKEIAQAFHRDIQVRVITDNDKVYDRGSDIHYLAELGVPVRVDISSSHMHHKFAIFDRRTLVNGSFNWTRSASQYNEENIVISYEAELLTRFANLFSDMWGSDQLEEVQAL